MAPTVAAEATAAAKGRQQHTGKAVGLAAHDASGHLAPLTITRRYVRARVSRHLSYTWIVSYARCPLLERSRSHAARSDGGLRSKREGQRTPSLGVATVPSSSIEPATGIRWWPASLPGRCIRTVALGLEWRAGYSTSQFAAGHRIVGVHL